MTLGDLYAAGMKIQREREQNRLPLLSDQDLATELSVRPERWAAAIESHGASQAIHLVQHALQPVQGFILRPRACWLSRAGSQVDDLAGFMALNGGSPALRVNRECVCQLLIAEARLPALFVFQLDLHPGCVEITQPPGNPNGA